ncbi:hypothetical protein CRENPOLYSF2_2990002 [Crenothrix polyspora]|uniref:Uncharacterized protein n=1 Tax=Crenothrix polyspora TaxID=360316 RepID=A0A1R4H9N1_9GAMM|nr:hypothetical protein CRENPOLYSF2_2990002 [Crenothrix polyspora]
MKAVDLHKTSKQPIKINNNKINILNDNIKLNQHPLYFHVTPCIIK